jgi:hypothetical protein
MVSSVAKKIRRVHKNQAVNLVQIVIHGPDLPFAPRHFAVKFHKSSVAAAFQPIKG